MQNDRPITDFLILLPVALFFIMYLYLCVDEWRRRDKESGLLSYLPVWFSFPLSAVLAGRVCLLSGEFPDMGTAALVSLLSLSYIISCPAREDKPYALIFLSAGSFIISLSSLLASDILSRIYASMTEIDVLVFIAGLLIIVSTLFRTKKRFSRVRSLFSNEQVWHHVMDYSSVLYSMGALFLMMVFTRCYDVEGIPGIIVNTFLCVVLSILYYIIFKRRMGDKSYFFGRKKEIHIQAVIRGRLKDNLAPDESSEGRHMNTMYKKVLNYMEQKKPYLDDNFSLKDLSTSMYTNKVYLSKTINSLSGRNFSQFVNYHRINYSMNLLKEDPFLKINEVAMMSGFHTVVSYNMAFKLFNNETPSDWVRRYRASLVK